MSRENRGESHVGMPRVRTAAVGLLAALTAAGCADSSSDFLKSSKATIPHESIVNCDSKETADIDFRPTGPDHHVPPEIKVRFTKELLKEETCFAAHDMAERHLRLYREGLVEELGIGGEEKPYGADHKTGYSFMVYWPDVAVVVTFAHDEQGKPDLSQLTGYRRIDSIRNEDDDEVSRRQVDLYLTDDGWQTREQFIDLSSMTTTTVFSTENQPGPADYAGWDALYHQASEARDSIYPRAS